MLKIVSGMLKVVSGVEGSFSRRGVELFECVTGYSFNRSFQQM